MTNYCDGEKIGNIKIERSTKVLGYMLDEHCNNIKHIEYIKKNRKSIKVNMDGWKIKNQYVKKTLHIFIIYLTTLEI